MSKASSLSNILCEVLGSDPVFSQLLSLLRIRNPEGLGSSSSLCPKPLLLEFGQHCELMLLWGRKGPVEDHEKAYSL